MTTSCYLPVFYCLESFDSFVFISQSSYAATKLENTSLSGQVTTFTLDSFVGTHQVFTVNFSGLFYCLIVNVRLFHCCSLATALIEYHHFTRLSTPYFKNFDFFKITFTYTSLLM